MNNSGSGVRQRLSGIRPSFRRYEDLCGAIGTWGCAAGRRRMAKDEKFCYTSLMQNAGVPLRGLCALCYM